MLALWLVALPAWPALQPTKDLTSLWAQYEFDPKATNSGVLVQINDAHFAGVGSSSPYTDDFDPTLVRMIADIAPAALFINGDLISTASKTEATLGDRE